MRGLRHWSLVEDFHSALGTLVTTDVLWQSVFDAERNNSSDFIDNLLFKVVDAFEGYGEAWQYLFPLVAETVFFGMCHAIISQPSLRALANAK